MMDLIERFFEFVAGFLHVDTHNILTWKDVCILALVDTISILGIIFALLLVLFVVSSLSLVLWRYVYTAIINPQKNLKSEYEQIKHCNFA